MVGRTHDIQCVAVIIFRNLQNNQIEPHSLRIKYFRIKCGENVPHVSVVNYGVIAGNKLPEIFIRIDGVAHCSINPFLRFFAFTLCARFHFLHVFALAVDGSRGQHFLLLARRRFERIHQRAVLIR